MRRGVLLAAAAGMLWGTIPLAVKQVYLVGSATALEISFFRFLIAFAALYVIAKVKNQAIILTSKWSVLMGFWGVFWMSFVSFYGIQYTAAVNATILFNSNPLFVAGLVYLLKWETLRYQALSGILLGISGVVLVSGAMRMNVYGDSLVLLGAFGWAVYTIVGYKLKEYSSLSVTTSSLFWGLLFFVPFLVLFTREIHVTWPAWGWILYIGALPTAVAFAAYVKAVEQIGSTRASVFQYLAPAVAVVLSLGLGLEQVHLFQIAGVILIVVGIELTRRSKQV